MVLNKLKLEANESKEIDNPCAKKIKINENQLVDSRGTLVCDMNLQNTFR